MAVVKSEQVWVDDRPFTRKVKCDAHGRFSCELPDYVKEEMPGEEAAGRSMDDCLGAWAALIKQYENRTTETRKIIGFKFSTDISFSEGIALCVSARVLEEKITTHKDGKKVYTYSAVDNEMNPRLTKGFSMQYRGKRCEGQVPWTPEAEGFFNDLASAMQKLIDNLEGISSAETLLDFISSGQKLLQNKQN